MKKIFAIALAVVMVLSMTSAFAWCPTGFDWACSTYTCTNGTGSVELVPYVKGNACPGENTFAANTCAGAVNNDWVFFAVKVTVDADPSADWWAKAALEVSTKGMVANTMKMGTKAFAGTLAAGKMADLVKGVKDNKGELKAGEYYLVFDATAGVWAFVKAADFEAGANSLFTVQVNDAAKAKVCAKLTSENSFTSAEINGYTVTYKAGKAGSGAYSLEIKKGSKAVEVYLDKDEKIEKFVVYDLTGGVTKKFETETYTADGSKFFAGNGVDAVDFSCNEFGKFLKDVMDYFKFAFDTCITDKAVKANFGWDAKVESCFSWNSNVQAVVDAECVVAIPKTGDASVLAWLF